MRRLTSVGEGRRGGTGDWGGPETGYTGDEERRVRDERSAKSLTTKHHFTFGSSPDGAKKLREIARIGMVIMHKLSFITVYFTAQMQHFMMRVGNFEPL